MWKKVCFKHNEFQVNISHERTKLKKKKKLKKKRQDNTKKRNKDCGEIHIHKTKHMSLKHCAIHLLLRYLRKIEMWGDMLAALR